MTDSFEAFLRTLDLEEDDNYTHIFGSSSSTESLDDIMNTSPNNNEKKKKSRIKSKAPTIKNHELVDTDSEDMKPNTPKKKNKRRSPNLKKSSNVSLSIGTHTDGQRNVKLPSSKSSTTHDNVDNVNTVVSLSSGRHASRQRNISTNSSTYVSKPDNNKYYKSNP